MDAKRLSATRLQSSGRAKAGQRGQVLIELAIVIPFLLVLVFGIVEYGFIISNQISLINSARAGARAGAFVGATQSQAQNAAQSAATNLTNCPLHGSPSAAYSTDPNNAAKQQVRVTVSCDYLPLTPLTNLTGGVIRTAVTLSATVKMRVEQ